MKDVKTEIEAILKKHEGLSKLELVLGMILARLETLQVTLMLSRFPKGSEELRTAADEATDTLLKALDVSLSVIEDPKRCNGFPTNGSEH